MGSGTRHTNGASAARRVLTVSELTSDIKSRLETAYPFVWVIGEVSNLSTPSSGHLYFSLKDDKAQVQAVMFKSQARALRFRLEPGARVTGFGRLTVYPPRGNYQLVFEYLEPHGTGSLQLAFEQLKSRLSAEGLFDSSHKRPLPRLPGRVALVTSPSGAVVHDMLKVLRRRFPNLHVEIVPVRVQGEGAAGEIALALSTLNRLGQADVIVLARGGGSLEDLQAFNAESVARAISDSEIPVVSAVGHETDFTIADFVADQRASTPTAAAELVVPVEAELRDGITHQKERMLRALKRRMDVQRQALSALSLRLVHPRRQIELHRLQLDDVTARLERRFRHLLEQKTGRHATVSGRLSPAFLQQRIGQSRKILENETDRLHAQASICLNGRRSALSSLEGRLVALSPLSVLERGYSVVRLQPENRILTRSTDAGIGDEVHIQLASGTLVCRIEDISHGKEDL